MKCFALSSTEWTLDWSFEFSSLSLSISYLGHNINENKTVSIFSPCAAISLVLRCLWDPTACASECSWNSHSTPYAQNRQFYPTNPYKAFVFNDCIGWNATRPTCSPILKGWPSSWGDSALPAERAVVGAMLMCASCASGQNQHLPSALSTAHPISPSLHRLQRRGCGHVT